MIYIKTNVYRHDAAYAREHGELAAYRASKNMNAVCKAAIEEAVRANFDGMHLKHHSAGEVVKEFGPDRVEYVLAATVQYKDWDGRFSRDTKEWARQITLPYEDRMDIPSGYIVESHPAVLDGFIRLARKEIEEAKSTLGRPSALEQLRMEQSPKKAETKDAKHKEESR